MAEALIINPANATLPREKSSKQASCNSKFLSSYTSSWMLPAENTGERGNELCPFKAEGTSWETIRKEASQGLVLVKRDSELPQH